MSNPKRMILLKYLKI